jgi:NifU-like protein involved in Fe-S cluster formation
MTSEPGVSEAVIQVTGHSGNAPGQGPFMKIHLAVSHSIILNATYETYQCPGCVVCGKAICELVAQKGIEEARKITHPILIERVGPLPRHRQICYGLALLALSDALEKL